MFLSQKDLGINNKNLFNNIIKTLKYRVKDMKITEGLINKKINEKALYKLDYLELEDLTIDNLNFLKHFPNLSELFISNISGLKDISGVTYLVNLKEIDINKTLIKDFSPFEVCQNIEEFSYTFGEYEDNSIIIDSSNSLDFSFLTRLPKLKIIDLTGCGIKDISFLSLCPNLEEITLNSNPINSTLPLTSLKKLGYLFIEGCNLTKIDGVEQFAEMPTLSSLLCNDNNFSPEDTKYYKEKISHIEITDI